MKVESLPLYDEQISLADFEQKHGLEMTVKQRTPEQAAKSGFGKWWACFEHNDNTRYSLSLDASSQLSGMTTSFSAEGNTPDEAIAAYLKGIAGKKVVPDLADRTKDFWVGQITYTPA
jgi:hypothetical protein